MKLERWNPLRELEDMSDRLNRMFTGGFASASSERFTTPDWSPSCDICELPEEYLVKVELPEVKREDIKVSVEDGVMQIHGERRLEKEEKNRRYHRLERSYGSFARTFTLPQDVDDNRIKADFKDGMLMVHVAKGAASKPKAIDVKVA